MGLFSTTARERAKKTWEAATLAKRSLDDAALQMDEIERTMKRITEELPQGTDGSAMQEMQKAMELTERHAYQTKEHLEHLKTQLRKFEAHLRRRKR